MQVCMKKFMTVQPICGYILETIQHTDIVTIKHD